MHFKKLLLIIFLLTINCSNNKVVKNHGISALDLKSDKITISKSNKNDVIKILGKPSSISLFDENVWFYIQRENINQSILMLGKQKLEKNNILEISFDEYSIVKNTKLYNIENMEDLKIVKSKTENPYSVSSGLNKLLRSINQKINSPKQSRQRN
tara:strand:+ start:77 stop:541 length:465 start_codon:yes stop_codon:yes gene_type:complete